MALAHVLQPLSHHLGHGAVRRRPPPAALNSTLQFAATWGGSELPAEDTFPLGPVVSLKTTESRASYTHSRQYRNCACWHTRSTQARTDILMLYTPLFASHINYKPILIAIVQTLQAHIYFGSIELNVRVINHARKSAVSILPTQGDMHI